MKKIMNDPKDFVKEEVEGIIAAYGDKISLLNDDFRMVIRKDAPVKGKVGIVTGGGSGHLPLFLGYVGEGMLDGCAVGNVFASPASSKMADLIRACDAGAGVLCLFGNYGGDLLNFKMACEDVEFDDIKTEILLGFGWQGLWHRVRQKPKKREEAWPELFMLTKLQEPLPIR